MTTNGSTTVEPQETPVTITSEIINLTPALAEQLLAKHPRNRRVSKAQVENLAGAIRRGEWVLNGEALKLDAAGNLVDGQHRCLAVVASGIAIETLIIRGVDSIAQDTMDTGRKRSVADALSLAGEKNTRELSSAIVAVLNLRSGMFHKQRGSITAAQAKDFLEGEPDIRDAVLVGKRLSVAWKFPKGPAAALYHEFRRVDPEDADAFIEALVVGDGLEQGDPLHTLRTTFTHDLAKVGGRRMSTEYRVAITIKAWNAWRRGEQVKLLKWRPGGNAAKREPFPAYDEAVEAA